MPSDHRVKARRAWLSLVGVAVSLLGVVLTLFSVSFEGGVRLVPRMDPSQLGAALRTVPVSASLAFVVLTYLTLPLRAARWGLILGTPGRYRDRYHACAIGFAAVHVLPARLGEITRGIVLASRVPGLSSSQAVGSVLLARALDLIALWICCLPLPLLIGDRVPAPMLWGGIGLLGLLSLGAIGIVFAARYRGARVAAWLGRRGHEKIEAVFRTFCEGLAPAVGRKRLLLAVLATVVVQLVSAFAYSPLLIALAPKVPPFSGAVFGLAVLSLGLAIPSTPSGVGVYHWALAFGLRLLGADAAPAAALAIVTHLGSLAVFVAAGLASMVGGRFSFASLRRRNVMPAG